VQFVALGTALQFGTIDNLAGVAQFVVDVDDGRAEVSIGMVVQ